jgi:hypothetical protein
MDSLKGKDVKSTYKEKGKRVSKRLKKDGKHLESLELLWLMKYKLAMLNMDSKLHPED